MTRPVILGIGALLVAFTAAHARADTCSGSQAVSSCFDADNVWPVAAPSRFVAIDDSPSPAAASWALSVFAAYLARPVVVRAASPDPEGREVRVIDDRVELALLAAYAPLRRLRISAAVAVVHQTGSGTEALISRQAPEQDGLALRDPRLGARYTLPPPLAAVPLLGRIGYEVSLPLGEELAGARSVVAAPTTTWSFSSGAVTLATEFGARFRMPVEFAGARLGTQLVTSFGAAVDLVQDRVALASEVWLWPVLIEQRNGGALHPAEWLLSVSAAPVRELRLRAGAGTALPLSSGGDDISNDDTFAGVTTPQARLLFAITYAPHRDD
jgi:hypothetical protein